MKSSRSVREEGFFAFVRVAERLRVTGAVNWELFLQARYTSGSMRKEDLERRYLDGFAQAVSEFPVGPVSKSENPDFLV